MSLDNSRLYFKKYSERIKQLKHTDIKELNHLIDEINSFSINCEHFDNQVVEEILIDICKFIPVGNDHILSKFCNQTYIFTYNHKVTFSTKCLVQLVKFMCDSTQSCGKWVLNDVLFALSALLYENSNKLEMFHKDLVGANGILIELITPTKYEPDIQYNALLCLKSLLMRRQGENLLSDELLENCCQTCVHILIENKDHVSDVTCMKIIIHALKCLQLIVTSKVVPASNLGKLLGILKYLSYCGLPGQISVTDVCLYPTLIFPNNLRSQNEHQKESDSSIHPKLRKQKKSRKSRTKKKSQTNSETGAEPSEEDSDAKASSVASSPLSHKFYRNNWTKNSSSDSEFSDAEGQFSKVKFNQVSVRQHAYQTLHIIVKTTDKKLMFGYWSSFLPDYPAMPGAIYSQTIFTSILKDSSPQIRFCALSLLTEMLRGSKQFLSFADDRNFGHISYTSLSSQLASLISEVHRNLLLVLLSEKSASLLTQVLKCYATLGENVPYKKLKNDILTKLLKHVTPFLQNKDTQVQVACLSVFSALLNSDQFPEEVLNQVLYNESMDIEAIPELSESFDLPKNQTPWLFRLCESNVLKNVPLPVRLESLQLLSSIVGKCFNKLQFYIPELEKIILFCLNESDSSLQLHGAKLLEVLGRCIMNDIFKTSSESEKIPKILIFQLWNKVLSSSLLTCSAEDSQKTLQSICCDCLSTIPSDVFGELNDNVQKCCITLLLGFASDANANVRGAAIRCLGVFSLFPCLKQDIFFLNDVADVLIKAVSDVNPNVRLKASWAFGNVSDALFLNRDDSFFQNRISVQFFCTSGMACISFSKDCDRVRANAVRALGNFLRYLPESYIEKSIVQDFAVESCSSLKSAIETNNVKVCWNACYAIGNVLKNTALITSKAINVEDLLKCLINVLRSPNFKVRISSVQALTLLPDRCYYGNLFSTIWLQLIVALYSAVDDVNFKEIKHQENLCDQICYSICQMAAFMSNKDASLIAKESVDSSEMLLTSMWKFGQRTVEDKISVVDNSIEHVFTLTNTDDICKEVKNLLEILKDIFSQARIAFYDKQTKIL